MKFSVKQQKEDLLIITKKKSDLNHNYIDEKTICFEDNFALLLALLFVQNNESAVMFVYKKNPVGIELFSRVQTLFYSKRFAKLLTT